VTVPSLVAPIVFEIELWPAVALGGTLVAAGFGWRWLSGRRRARLPAALPAALAVAQRRIRDFAAAQGGFVFTLADELREPLATALDHAELLVTSSSEPATVERFAAGLVEDLQHLSGLVDSYLRLAQPVVQADPGRMVPVHVHEVLLAAAQRCRNLAATRGVTIVPVLAELHDGAPVEVLGDSILLESMLESLVRNGILASPRGAVVELRVQVVGDQVHVAVHDTGPPLPPGAVEDVMFAFFPSVPPRRPLAAGLSLAVAMRVAEHHRGSISLANGPEGGCKVELQLPRWVAGPSPSR
jgi:two-component system, OmpR family, sensor histidine kinase CreC